ncbi:hypothetical protein H0X10_02005 [Candidatus Saccharibacteria bacterium]|nr:hypothetical protein [Candidatus Saccharibacteria bacterium]
MTMPFYDSCPEDFRGDAEASKDFVQAEADFEETNDLLDHAAAIRAAASSLEPTNDTFRTTGFGQFESARLYLGFATHQLFLKIRADRLEARAKRIAAVGNDVSVE